MLEKAVHDAQPKTAASPLSNIVEVSERMPKKRQTANRLTSTSAHSSVTRSKREVSADGR
jgi:hypothetical protein